MSTAGYKLKDARNGVRIGLKRKTSAWWMTCLLPPLAGFGKTGYLPFEAQRA